MDVFAGDVRAADTDLVIAGAFEGDASGLAAMWSAPTSGEIDRATGSKEFSGKLYDTFVTPIADREYLARGSAAVGLGRKPSRSIARTRRRGDGPDGASEEDCARRVSRARCPRA